MIWFLVQLSDLFVNHTSHPFVIFCSYVWFVFLVKFSLARKYKPYAREVPNITTSAIIIVFREDPDVLRRCVESVIENRPDELLAVIDERDKGRYEALLDTLGVPYTYAPPGKREAIALGIRRTKGEIIFLVDSDSIMEKNAASEMLKAFNDPEVGGVTPTQRILNPSSIYEDIADWMEDIRWKISNRAMSAKGCVGCLPGRVIAFRRVAIEPHLEEFLNERFLGRKCVTGDDRVLTSIALRNGFKTVYQSTAKIFTTCPSDFKTFTKMHLRWARSSQRETVKALRWYVKKPFILPFSFITDIITPFFFTAILISAIMNILLHFNPTLIIRGTIYDTFLLGGMILGYIGMNISLGVRQIPHLREYKHDIPLLLVWTLFMSFVMVPIRILGFLTMAKQDWMTRYEKLENRVVKGDEEADDPRG